MAKLRINGDSSGYVDLEAPNASSSRTIDVDQLPELNVANTFSADMSFGDNNKVNLGAGNDLQLYHDGYNNYIKSAASGWLNVPLSGNGMTVADSNFSNIFFKIDSSGRVVMPKQPAFSIYGDTNPNWTSDVIYIGHTGSGAAAFDTNIGNHFSYTTGKFTAPVAGTYFFSFRATTGDTNSHFMDIHKNGARVGGHVLSYGYTYLTATNTCILTLASGDYIEARRRAANYSLYSVNFSGYLIG